MQLKNLVLAATLILGANLVFSADNGLPKSIDAVMAEIRGDLGLKASDKVDPNKVVTNRLEELGDSVMEVMAGSHEVHEQMEKRMGGEGSAFLASFHQRLGYQYLSGVPLGWMGGMMRGFFGGQTNFKPGGFMMGNLGQFGPYGMMGGFGYFGFLMGGLILVLIVLAVFFIVRAASGKSSSGETAMDILKKRYAKGEITKDDLERMKKDL